MLLVGERSLLLGEPYRVSSTPGCRAELGGLDGATLSACTAPQSTRELHECRQCCAFCDRIVHPSGCIASGCRYLYLYDDEDTGRRFMGCMNKVFRVEIDLELFHAAERTRHGFGGVKMTGMPLPQCRTSVERAYDGGGEPSTASTRTSSSSRSSPTRRSTCATASERQLAALDQARTSRYAGSTAEGAATLRAASRPLGNPDHLAARFVPWSLRLNALVRLPLGSALARRLIERIVPGALVFEVVRTQFMDDVLRDELKAGARQLVILGAGFDSRAYRFEELLAGVAVFEVDHPLTSRLKRERVRSAFGVAARARAVRRDRLRDRGPGGCARRRRLQRGGPHAVHLVGGGPVHQRGGRVVGAPVRGRALGRRQRGGLRLHLPRVPRRRRLLLRRQAAAQGGGAPGRAVSLRDPRGRARGVRGRARPGGGPLGHGGGLPRLCGAELRLRRHVRGAQARSEAFGMRRPFRNSAPRLQALLAQPARGLHVLLLGRLAGHARALEDRRQALEARLGEERRAAGRRPARPSPSGAWRSRFEPSGVFESFTCRQRTPLEAHDLARSRRSPRSARRRCGCRSRWPACGSSRGRARAARRRRPARSARPAPRRSARGCRRRRRCSRAAGGSASDSSSASRSTSPTRSSASSCGSPSGEPGCSTTPAAPIASPSRSAWMSEASDFLRDLLVASRRS